MWGVRVWHLLVSTTHDHIQEEDCFSTSIKQNISVMLKIVTGGVLFIQWPSIHNAPEISSLLEQI
jgi:hypothetical protein